MSSDDGLLTDAELDALLSTPGVMIDNNALTISTPDGRLYVLHCELNEVVGVYPISRAPNRPASQRTKRRPVESRVVFSNPRYLRNPLENKGFNSLAYYFQ
jgi:hypothetical protein